MKQTQEIISNNGWQNIGIMTQYSYKTIPHKYRDVFLKIVTESFGYKRNKTAHLTQDDWSVSLGISKKTFISHIKWLEENNHIKINTLSSYVQGGGSKPQSYSPCFVRGLHVFIDGVKKKTVSDENF